MAIRVLVYAKQGEGQSSAAASQIRSLIREMGVDATVQIVTDPMLHEMNGVDETPSISIDGLMISRGWAPSRNEMIRAIKSRLTR